jgi:hypothetical protein
MRKSTLAFFLLVFALVRSASAADFTVTNTNSSGPGSLAQAITDANNLPGADRILFNIAGAGVHKIDVSQTPLPNVLESLTIDGYSQPGAKPNSLAVGDNAIILIQLDAGNATKPGTGLVLLKSPTPNGGYLPSNYIVRGLSLTGFIAQQTDSSFPYVKHTSSALGIGDVDSAVIAGNFVGLLPDGETPRGNYRGVGSGSTTATVGGTDPASRNVISGNTGFGVSGGGVAAGNYIGTNASGTKAVPNEVGVFYLGANAICGGTQPGAGNVISGNTTAVKLGEGYYTYLPYPHNDYTTEVGARIQGNLIGLAADGITPLPNKYSINLSYGSTNTIGGTEPGAGNIIAFNGSGINVASSYSFCASCGTTAPPRSEGNQILSNAIYANGGLPIDLSHDGPTPNDVGDPDIGPNTLQNSPVIESAAIANGSVTIKGRLNTTADSQFTLQYFSESLDLAPAVQTYLGSGTVTTDANGNAQFSAAFPIKDINVSFNMTATSQLGNTSEFSRNPGRLLNISTRAPVLGGDNTAIAGFILRENRALVLRALGPSLPLQGSLPDPSLEVYDSTGKLLASNDNWRDSSSANYIQQRGLAPTNDLESALLISLGPGNYTTVVRGSAGSFAVALVEAYDITQGGPGEAANISTRGVVQTGDNVMIAGIIIEPSSGLTRIVARALGPSLAAAGISNPLPDPVLELHDSQGAVIASNDNWRDGQPDALAAVGLTPSNDKESAIFTRVASGTYTAIVRGKGDTNGIALVEVYNLH